MSGGGTENGVPVSKLWCDAKSGRTHVPMKSVALVSGFEPFKGSTSVAKGYYEALRKIGYEVHWYQCGAIPATPPYVESPRTVRGISLGHRGIEQGVNFAALFPRRLGELPEDLVLLTDPLLLQLSVKNRNCVVVVHDLRELHARTRTNLVSPVLFFFLLSRIRRCRGVIADTDATLRELKARVSELPRWAVIHPSASITGDGTAHIQESLDRLVNQQRQQLLYVAVDRPYKRVRHIVDLARGLDRISNGLDIRIVLVSKLRPSTQRYVNSVAPRCLSILPEVADIEDVYNTSDVLVYPSEFEGFGLPVTEAMAFGIPVVASQAEAVREVLGGVGTVVEGYDLSSWTSALDRLHDPRTYGKEAEASLNRGREFSSEAFRARLSSVLTEWGL